MISLNLQGEFVRKATILALCFVLATSSYVFFGATKVSALKTSDLLDRLRDPNGPIMVASHRGDWRSHPENSLSGIQSAIEMGVDMVEIDISKTSDGKLILMHDSSVDRTTNGKGNVSSMTLGEIKKLKLKEGQGGSKAELTDETVPTLEEALNLTKGKVLVNLDKSWSIRDDVWSVLVNTGTTAEGVFKSSASNSEVDAWLDSKSPRPLYQAVVGDENVYDLDKLIAGSQPDLYELIFDDEVDAQISSKNICKIMNAGKRIWINTLWGSLSANHTDAMSLDDPDSGWGWVINRGATFIQTDNSRELIEWLESEGYRHRRYS